MKEYYPRPLTRPVCRKNQIGFIAGTAEFFCGKRQTLEDGHGIGQKID
jgi:hypothetical protein